MTAFLILTAQSNVSRAVNTSAGRGTGLPSSCCHGGILAGSPTRKQGKEAPISSKGKPTAGVVAAAAAGGTTFEWRKTMFLEMLGKEGQRRQEATTARRRRACVPVLPDELLLAKALLRCRAVCRSWRRLTSAADFVLAHHQIQPSLPLVFLHGTIRGASVTGATLDAFDLWATPADERRRPTLRFKHSKHYREFKVYASCDGLLLFSLSSRSRFYICNPATRQWMLPLPMMLIGSHVAGLYRHSSSGEYRVLYMKKQADADRGVDVDAAAYFVLTVGSGAEPRCVGQPATSASIRQYMTAGPGMPSSLGARLSCSMDHVSSYR
nr:unnamed protein product [Digitaria exilis]